MRAVNSESLHLRFTVRTISLLQLCYLSWSTIAKIHHVCFSI